MIFVKAVETLDHFPSIAELGAIATKIGIYPESGVNIPEENKDCFGCGGTGYVFVLSNDDRHESIASCERCERGRYFSSQVHKPCIPSLSRCEKKGWKFLKLVP